MQRDHQSDDQGRRHATFALVTYAFLRQDLSDHSWGNDPMQGLHHQSAAELTFGVYLAYREPHEAAPVGMIFTVYAEICRSSRLAAYS